MQPIIAARQMFQAYKEIILGQKWILQLLVKHKSIIGK
jgi:hypothetical protein